MDIKLKEKDSFWTEFRSHLKGDIVDINCQLVPMSDLEGVFKWFCKEIQRNAIEVAVQRCSEKAVADYETVDNYVGLIIEQTVETEKTDPIKVYVINTTILDCKQKLFEENNLM